MPVRLNHKRVTNGKNSWHIDATVSGGAVTVERVYRDVTDPDGLRDAVHKLVDSKPRYQRK